MAARRWWSDAGDPATLGSGTYRLIVADFTGDGRADAGILRIRPGDAPTTSLYLAKSGGTAFGNVKRTWSRRRRHDAGTAARRRRERRRSRRPAGPRAARGGRDRPPGGARLSRRSPWARRRRGGRSTSRSTRSAPSSATRRGTAGTTSSSSARPAPTPSGSWSTGPRRRARRSARLHRHGHPADLVRGHALRDRRPDRRWTRGPGGPRRPRRRRRWQPARDRRLAAGRRRHDIHGGDLVHRRRDGLGDLVPLLSPPADPPGLVPPAAARRRLARSPSRRSRALRAARSGPVRRGTAVRLPLPASTNWRIARAISATSSRDRGRAARSSSLTSPSGMARRAQPLEQAGPVLRPHQEDREVADLAGLDEGHAPRRTRRASRSRPGRITKPSAYFTNIVLRAKK